ncbi:MAG: ATP-binding protein [Syntrophales bacterium]
MPASSRTTSELIEENAILKRRIRELEYSESDSKRTEEALRESEDLFRSLVDYMHDAMIIITWEGSILFANRAAARIIEYDRAEEFVGHNIVEYIHPDSLQKAAVDLDAVKADKMGFLSEYQLRSVTGRHIWVESIGGKIIFRRATANLVCIRDITDRKRMEEELLRAHKLESLGVLAGGIAHDFNNLMAIVQGYIDLALMELPPEHVSCQRLLNAIQSVEQTKDLTSRLITFSRGGSPHREIFDIMEIIRDAIHRTVKGTDIKVKFDFEKDLWPAEADELQMKQCFYNLTTNAVEAMPEGGNLTIHAENVLISDRQVSDLKEGPYIKITFADEGIGIPEVHLSKIFDPYFTTKKMAAQKGLGLGLSVCYSVLKNHHGHITVNSQSGKGASFVLYLTARPDLAKEKGVKQTSSTGTVRVLVMDDEPRLREIERAYLERMGYEVTDVKDGQEAIDAYRKALYSRTPFDLVMLDLTVCEGMGGQKAMEQLLKIDPSIRAIIASGFVDDPLIENYSDYGFQGAIKKPFKREEMENLVGMILQGRNNI